MATGSSCVGKKLHFYSQVLVCKTFACVPLFCELLPQMLWHTPISMLLWLGNAHSPITSACSLPYCAYRLGLVRVGVSLSHLVWCSVHRHSRYSHTKACRTTLFWFCEFFIIMATVCIRFFAITFPLSYRILEPENRFFKAYPSHLCHGANKRPVVSDRRLSMPICSQSRRYWCQYGGCSARSERELHR